MCAQEISDGHADLRAYLSRDRQIHWHRDGEKRPRPEFPFSVGKGFGSNSIGIYASMVVALLAAVYLLWHLGRKQKLVPPKKPA